MKFISAICFSILAFAAVSQAQVCQPAPVGLVSWYAADGNALDSRSRNNGTLQNGATFAAGQNGQAFSFDGNDDRVVVPSNATLDPPSGRITAEAWVFLTASAGGQGSIIDKRTTANNAGYVLGKTAFDNLSWAVFVGGNLFFVNSASALPLNTWTHVAGTYDGTTLTIYINGQNAGSVNSGGGSVSTTTGDLIIGENIANSSNWTGLIDEASVYDRALPASEIAAIANAGTAGKCKPTATVAPSGQVAWFAGDGNANDIAGTNNGTLGASSQFVVGKVGQAFQTTSTTGDTVTIPDSASLDFTNAFTIEMWVSLGQVGASNGTSFLACKGNCGSVGTFPYSLVLNNNGSEVFLRVGNSSAFDALPSSPLPLNTFTHIAGTYDGTTMRIYVNGVLSNSKTTTIGTLVNSSDPFTVGGSTGSGNALGIYDETSFYNRALIDAEITSIFNAGIAGKLKETTTSGTTATVGDATVTFASSASRTTQEIPLLASLFPALPMANATGLVYEIASNVSVSNPIVCFNLPSFTTTQFTGLRIFHFEAGVWQPRTAATNTYPTLCTTGLPSLSPFAIGFNAPTAASVSIGGRVHSANGKPIARARISLTDSSGETRQTFTNLHGFYRFDDVPAGETYIITASHRFIQFTQSSQVHFIGEENFGIDFVAQ